MSTGKTNSLFILFVLIIKTKSYENHFNAAANPRPAEDVQGDDRWRSQHRRYVNDAKHMEPDVLLIGDFYIQQLAQTGLWNKLFEPLNSLNFGIDDDQTQNVLWRVQNGELDGSMNLKVIVLMVGTNNYGQSTEQVAGGIFEIVKALQQKQPQAHVIVMGIPPRGQHPNPLREKIAAINSIVSDRLSEFPDTEFQTTDPDLFINAEGIISHTDMYDYLHLTTKGYQKLFELLVQNIKVALQTKYLKVGS